MSSLNLPLPQLNAANYSNWRFRVECLLDKEGMLEAVRISDDDEKKLTADQRVNYAKMETKGMPIWGGVFIAYFVLLIFSSVLMVAGINMMLRGFMLPWLVLMIIGAAFQALFGLWLLYGYYIYLAVVVPTLVNWLWMGYNIYCILCVYSQYQIIYLMQTPNIELLYP
ncbi:hypothetical protein GE061_016832 [Apolygus lucorum]|uniref:Uncharacterized protein n=1 Tax=Apolygus lucorum TaxID=248454 RepID=A0A8S9XJE4_APOLU|nr:hypothetical protein GE061_016832 [Apolygus lucorum]